MGTYVLQIEAYERMMILCGLKNYQMEKFRYAERYLDPLTGKQKKVSVTIDKNTKQMHKLATSILNQKIAEKHLQQKEKLL